MGGNMAFEVALVEFWLLVDGAGVEPAVPVYEGRFESSTLTVCMLMT
jgi:hypothetical protein